MCEIKKHKLIINIKHHLTNTTTLTNVSKYSQFYTKQYIAEYCYSIFEKLVDSSLYDYIIEPSAGTGSFYKLLPSNKRIGFDIEPKCEGIELKNYFDYVPNEKYKYIVIGNPPFGKIGSDAIKFFNKSAEFCDIISFILPRTFKRVSVQNKLNLNFHLLYSEDLPLKPCCFEPSMTAKCCFQIWTRKNEPRNKIIYDKSHRDFTFLKLGPLDKKGQPTPPIGADFVIKAYGGNCGEIICDGLEKLRPKSWHWIQSNIDVENLKNNFKMLDYSISKDTVRQDSIGQQEVIHLYKSKFT